METRRRSFFLKHGGFDGFDGNKSVKIYLILLFQTVNNFITMEKEYINISDIYSSYWKYLLITIPLLSMISVKSARSRDFLQEVELPV